MNRMSVYKGEKFFLTTKHGKSIALSGVFKEKLDVEVVDYEVDTDILGTFSGEVEAKRGPLETVQTKCEWSIKDLGVDFALATEGRFAPHPEFLFLPSHCEIIYFIDVKRDFSLYLREITCETNFSHAEVGTLEELYAFSEKVGFPSHGLILRPDAESKVNMVKGIIDRKMLEETFKEFIKISSNKKVFVETDMRACFNPSRMRVISNLGEKLASRLNVLCPNCGLPGWEESFPCHKCRV